MKTPSLWFVRLALAAACGAAGCASAARATQPAAAGTNAAPVHAMAQPVGLPVSQPDIVPEKPAVTAAAPSASSATQPGSQPGSQAGAVAASEIGHGTRALVISIDGCRPDIALFADMPNFRELMKTGSYTMYARTTYVAITLPSHTSMITGVAPDKHQVTWNDDADEKTFHYPYYPTLMQLAHAKGLTTAIVSSKSKFVALAKDVDFVGLPEPKKTTKAEETAEIARRIILEHKPQVMMLHFGDADATGHSLGWATPEQRAALERIDAGLGVVFKAMKEAGVYDDTLIILSADHGGAGYGHGGPDQRSQFIPWIAVGPNVRQGYDLTRNPQVAVRTEDTFATEASFLGLSTASDIDGHPVGAIWQRDELMEDSAPKRRAPKAAAPAK